MTASFEKIQGIYLCWSDSKKNQKRFLETEYGTDMEKVKCSKETGRGNEMIPYRRQQMRENYVYLERRPERNDFPSQKHVRGPLKRMAHSKSILLYNDGKAMCVQQLLLQRLDSYVFRD